MDKQKGAFRGLKAVYASYSGAVIKHSPCSQLNSPIYIIDMQLRASSCARSSRAISDGQPKQIRSKRFPSPHLQEGHAMAVVGIPAQDRTGLKHRLERLHVAAASHLRDLAGLKAHFLTSQGASEFSQHREAAPITGSCQLPRGSCLLSVILDLAVYVTFSMPEVFEFALCFHIAAFSVAAAPCIVQRMIGQ